MVGSAAAILLSSLTFPSRKGTLKSTRTSTRLPATSRLRRDLGGMAYPPGWIGGSAIRLFLVMQQEPGELLKSYHGFI